MNFNLFTVCIFATILVAFAKPIDESDAEEFIKQLVENCKEKTGATDEDVKAIEDDNLPETHEGLCMMECVLDGTQIMADGKFNKDGLIAAYEPMAKEAGVEEEMIEKAKQLADTCANEVGDGDEDRCVTAKMLVECFKEHAPDYGFDDIPPQTSDEE